MRLSIPADLAEFLASATAREASALLGVSGTQVRALREGKATALTPNVLRRWSMHQARDAHPVDVWQVRKVAADGSVSLGGQRFAAPALRMHAGQRAIVARLASGGVLVRPIAPQGGIPAKPVHEELHHGE